ncbi:hypothetical protein VNI00_005318 [Paramarasmius palmivorus]|uniref:Uncharacterized protein n=1 Tax=Paramarasmius palmivorus TaxID=297713 RepID=A0AAW0DBF7_9AGAR
MAASVCAQKNTGSGNETHNDEEVRECNGILQYLREIMGLAPTVQQGPKDVQKKIGAANYHFLTVSEGSGNLIRNG